jgi:predicted transcriptional regulator of viral defense system
MRRILPTPTCDSEAVGIEYSDNVRYLRRKYPMTAKPDSANAGERAMSIFKANGGVLNTEKAIKLGIHPRTLYALRDSARLDRMERGLYRLADAKPLGNPDFVTAALKVPRGVICLISALAFHQMTTQIPHAVYLAIAANDHAPVLRYPPLRLFWYSKAVYESGIIEAKMDGTNIHIYSAEKTLADCFKYRNKIGIDVCVEALNLYRQRDRMKLDQLEQYARLCRVQRVMRPYMEAVL